MSLFFLLLLLKPGTRPDLARFRLLSFSQSSQTRHIGADGNGLLFDICHRFLPLLKGDPLPIGSGDAYGRWGA